MTRETIVLLLACLALSVASPQKRTSDVCHAGSTALRELLLRHEEWSSYVYLPVAFDYFYEGITGYPVEAIPDDFLCDFDHLMTVVDLHYKLMNLGYTRIIFESAYNYFAVTSCCYRQIMDDNIQNAEPWVNITQSQHVVDLLTHLGESGVFSMNPEGFRLWQDMLPEAGQDVFFEDDELSTDPIGTQAARVTKDLRKVWNDAVWVLSDGHPNASQWLRDQVKHWSGLTIPTTTDNSQDTHAFMLLVITGILAAAKSDIPPPLSVLFDLLTAERVLNSVTYAVYPYIVQGIVLVEQYVEGSLYSGPGYENTADTADIAHKELRDLLLTLIGSLRSMNLLHLEQVESDIVVN